MSMWRRADATAMAAILAGTVLAIAGSGLVVGRLDRTDVSNGAYPAFTAPTRVHLHANNQANQVVRPSRPGVAGAPATTLGRPAGIAFYASSLGDGLSFEGDYSGRLTWDGANLAVDLPLAMVRRESADGAPTHLAGIALALAEDANTPRGWRIVRQGPLHLARDVMGTTSASSASGTGPDIWLRNVRLHLDGLTEPQLEGRWLVIVQQLDVEDATGSHPAWTYTPANRDLLARLMGGILGGC